ncbi:hypothetical protein D9M72_261100 [compost metagenome]
MDRHRAAGRTGRRLAVLHVDAAVLEHGAAAKAHRQDAGGVVPGGVDHALPAHLDRDRAAPARAARDAGAQDQAQAVADRRQVAGQPAAPANALREHAHPAAAGGLEAAVDHRAHRAAIAAAVRGRCRQRDQARPGAERGNAAAAADALAEHADGILPAGRDAGAGTEREADCPAAAGNAIARVQ